MGHPVYIFLVPLNYVIMKVSVYTETNSGGWWEIQGWWLCDLNAIRLENNHFLELTDPQQQKIHKISIYNNNNNINHINND